MGGDQALIHGGTREFEEANIEVTNQDNSGFARFHLGYRGRDPPTLLSTNPISVEPGLEDVIMKMKCF